MYQPLNPAASRGGSESLQDLVHAGLSIVDNQGGLRPQLAEAVPSLENGLWKVLPNGRMETTWMIRDGARWQDGKPFTAEDLVFTIRVGQDPELAEFDSLAYRSLDRAEAIDAKTVKLTWNRTYIDADSMFTRGLIPPLPRHILEGPLADSKAGFNQLAYWGEEFVGAGPYRIREWVRGSHVTLVATNDYLHGRPKIEQIEVRFVSDLNALAANVLAGEIEVTLGKSLSLEPALAVQARWTSGRMEVTPANPIQIHPQFLNPDPAIVGDVRFRRALYQAIDRQELIDALLAGQSVVAHSWLSPIDPPQYKPIEASIVRYTYDPQSSVRAIEGLGYTRGPEGQFRDASGQELALEYRTVAADINEKILLSVSHGWRGIGVGVDPIIVPPQRLTEMPYRAIFPALEMTRGSGDLGTLGWIHSKAARTAENNYRGSGGTNYPRYMNPEFDALIDAFSIAIPLDERIRLGGQIVHHMTDQLIEMPLFYDTEPTLIRNNLKNITARQLRSSHAWNGHEWDKD